MTPCVSHLAWTRMRERLFECSYSTACAFLLRPEYKRAIRMGCNRIVNHREGFTIVIENGVIATVLGEARRTGAPRREEKMKRRRARP